MTLSTMVVLHEWTDPIELHTWFNREVLGVADKNPIINQSETHIGNQLGQGFDAIFDIDWERGHAPLVWYDVEGERAANRRYVPDIYPTIAEADEAAEEMVEYYGRYPEGVIKIDWDTSYGYGGPGGIGCTELHAMFIVRLAKEYLQPRGITFAWQNEYSGEWNEGLTGFEKFGKAGAEAAGWFANVAVPAIAREVFGNA